MTGVEFRRLTRATAEVAASIERWENDPDLVPLIRPCPSREEQERWAGVSVETLEERIAATEIYLIYADAELVGEMSARVDPSHLYRKISGTAWIGITIGEDRARHRGIGGEAISFLEEQLKQQKIRRIELGVFEFNERAHRLYQRLGYGEIARIPDFTFWNERMWADIRMEKYL